MPKNNGKPKTTNDKPPSIPKSLRGGCLSSPPNKDERARQLLEITQRQNNVDNAAFSAALKTCAPAQYKNCIVAPCVHASITGEQGGNCIVKNWLEIATSGEVSDEQYCLVPKGYEVGSKKEQCGMGNITVECSMEIPASLCGKFPKTSG